MVDGPNGMGGVETVSVSVNGISSTTAASNGAESTEASLRAEGGVTQGELLRQEQRAGVVPVVQLAATRGDSDGGGEDDEVPHARGPQEVGMEDMGPQSAGSAVGGGGLHMAIQGIDVEAAVGRKAEVKEEEEKAVEAPRTPKREAEEQLASDAKRPKEEDAERANADNKSTAQTGQDGEARESEGT